MCTTDSTKFGKRSYELTTHEFIPNPKTDKNTFKVIFPNGTQITDTILDLEYVIGVVGIDDVPIVVDLKEIRSRLKENNPGADIPTCARSKIKAKNTSFSSETKKEDNLKKKIKPRTNVAHITINNTNRAVRKKHIIILSSVVGIACVLLLLLYMQRKRFIK